jgi:molybdopterin molybdotransferase
MPTMLQLEEARDRILATIQPLPAETVPLSEASGRILAGDFVAPLDLPGFDNSAMDGYAVQSDDLKAAGDATPVALKVVAEIPAGAQSAASISTGTCARIFTGSLLPAGADAVVMQEDTTSTDDTVSFHEPVKPWENVRLRGEDVKAGRPMLRGGDRLGVGAIALLGALGVASIAAHRQPLVGVLATGSELQEGGKPLAAGQIYESNRTALAAVIRSAGGEPRVFPVVPDTLEATRAALHGALEQCDLVITSGGVSVGELDFVKEAFQSLGGKLEFWRVAIRPGKPFVFGCLSAKRLFGLPGNPVSAVVTATLLVVPALLRAQGARDIELPSHLATAADEFRNPSDRRHFMRVSIDGEGRAHLSGLQASHALASLAAANALLDVPAATVIKPGAQVRVIRPGW